MFDHTLVVVPAHVPRGTLHVVAEDHAHTVDVSPRCSTTAASLNAPRILAELGGSERDVEDPEAAASPSPRRRATHEG